jgi:hypothetical protein
LKAALIESHYLPCIAYFSALSAHEEILVEKYEHYKKQSYRNRCYIQGPQKIEILTVPITGKHSKTITGEVRVDYGQKWLNSHWRTLQTAYGKSPFFEYYAADLHDILFKKPVFLYDLNLQIMTLCLKWLKRQVEVVETRSYDGEPSAGIADLRGAIDLKNIDGCNRFYKSTQYPQVFGSKFVPNLSLVDLIFNQGPGAWSLIKASALK